MNPKQLEILAVEIATGGVVKRTADQLVCIVRLIFYSGFKKAEIIDLVVRDVIDSKNKITQWIDNLKIIISGNSEAALREYLKSPKDRRPYLLERDAPLFPGYRNTKKLDRDLNAVGADYMDLIHSGVRHTYMELVDQGLERTKALAAVVELFRYDLKTVEKILVGKTAPAGARDDVYTRAVELFEKALYLKPDKNDALKEANDIISELEIMHQQAQDGHWKDQLVGIIRLTREILEPVFSATQNTNAETPDNRESRIKPPDLLKLIRSINSNSLTKPIDMDDDEDK